MIVSVPMLMRLRGAAVLVAMGLGVGAAALMATAADARTKHSWPAAYCFSGRWDLRTEKRAITVNSGSYVRARFSGTGIIASFDVAGNERWQQTPTQPGSFPTVAWRVDEGPWKEAEVAASLSLAEGLIPDRHTVMLMVRGMDEHQNRWTPPLVAHVTFTGFALSAGGRLDGPPAEWRAPSLKMEFLGDSITEGVVVNEGRAGVVEGIPFNWPWLADARRSYVGQTALGLGADWRQVGFGATGLLLAGSGGVPGALESFNLVYAGCPRDNWQPDVVVINQGTNEPSIPRLEYQSLYHRYLSLIRAAYPRAKLVALRPFNGSQGAAIRNVVEERRAKGDRKTFFIDTTGWYDGPLHPNIEGSAALAARLIDAPKSQVL